MIIVIDNYDSFTYNLVHYIGEFEQDIKVIRNDEMSVSEIMDNNPSKIVISPGPCTPKEAGISVELIKTAEVPILGVCLGHQAIGAAFGALIFGTVSMGIFYTDVDTDWFKVFLGAMMLIAVVFNNFIRKRVTESK